jgi:hypothetical protein
MTIPLCVTTVSHHGYLAQIDLLSNVQIDAILDVVYDRAWNSSVCAIGDPTLCEYPATAAHSFSSPSLCHLTFLV